MCRVWYVFLGDGLSPPERAEADGPGQPGRPDPGGGRGGRRAVGAHQHAEEVPARTQPQDGLHGGEAHARRAPANQGAWTTSGSFIWRPGTGTGLGLSSGALTRRHAVVYAFQTWGLFYRASLFESRV